MKFLLDLPGSDVPDWLLFLIPLVALVLVVQGGKMLYNWYEQKHLRHGNKH